MIAGARARSIAAASAALVAVSIGRAQAGPDPTPRDPLPLFELYGDSYRTPRAGEGFHTSVLGHEVDVPYRNRRSVSAWSLGVQHNADTPSSFTTFPFGSIYLWRRPDEDSLLRATIAGVFNEVDYLVRPSGSDGLGLVSYFENFTVPVERQEIIDGTARRSEELEWGYLRGGLGLGWWTEVEPRHNDSFFGFALTVEPGYFYFDRGEDTDPGFVVPQDTFEGRVRLRMRYDALERNLLELAHEGFAAGFDVIGGYRSNWEDWGVGGRERASGTDTYTLATGYAAWAGGLPFVDSDRHRLMFNVHAGAGGGVDRFSAQRVGGGPNAREWGANARPILPGAVLGEFFPDHYMVALGEYRFEPIFFVYLSLRGGVGWLDRDRWFRFVGGRLTSGFAFETRLQVDFNYNDRLVREGAFGGWELVFQLSKDF